MDLEFNSLEELYNRLKPALTSKKDELFKLGYKNIDEKDIWNYLSEEKWKKSIDLSLYDMVDDIINLNNLIIADYYKEKDGV